MCSTFRRTICATEVTGILQLGQGGLLQAGMVGCVQPARCSLRFATTDAARALSALARDVDHGQQRRQLPYA